MLRKKKYILVAASVVLSAGLLANASGCSSQEESLPVRQYYDGWTAITENADYYDFGVYKRCDGSTLMYMLSQNRTNRSGFAVIPNSPECAK